MIAVTRSVLAASLADAQGVNGHAKRPRAPRAGDAWPSLSGIERGPGQALLTNWVIHVWLGTDENDAMAKGDPIVTEVFESLEDVAHVESVSYVQLQTTVGDGIALEFRVRC